MTLTPNRNYRVLTSMDSEVDVDYDLLDFQAHQASDKSQKPQGKKAKRGRPAGTTKGGQAIAKQQKEHRELVLRALPDLGFYMLSHYMKSAYTGWPLTASMSTESPQLVLPREYATELRPSSSVIALSRPSI